MSNDEMAERPGRLEKSLEKNVDREELEVVELQGGEHVLEDLREILFDAVSGGFSIGFLERLSAGEADAFWNALLEDLGPNRRMWVARSNGRVLGTVQFERCSKPNGRHRAEVQKLLVHSRARGLGLGRRLMETLEAGARADGIRLLFLDTFEGSGAEQMYAHLGWQRAGVIPEYAAAPDGTLGATVLFYRLLDAH